jgi:Ser/Thr protein kinase RdoA (MazF antagonist)
VVWEPVVTQNTTPSGSEGSKITAFSYPRELWLLVSQCVLSQYPHGGGATPVQFLGSAGGFSGAQLWKLATSEGDWCLRGWPPGSIDPARLTWIHNNLSQIVRAGCRIVPRALPTREGTTLVAYDGRLWDLSPWLSGAANYGQAPTRAKLTAALQSLARFHRSARDAAASRPAVSASPSLANRLAMIRALDGGLWRELYQATQSQATRSQATRSQATRSQATRSQATRSQATSDLAQRARLILEHYRRCAPDVLQQVRAAQRLHARLQVCHGDLWHDHVLFSGEEVTGLVDFGAMKMESCAMDVARLLGSFVQDDSTLWEIGIAAYERIEPLSDADRALIAVFDQSTVLLSGMNWLKWLLLERRQFECWSRVLQRLDTIIARMSVMH